MDTAKIETKEGVWYMTEDEKKGPFKIEMSDQVRQKMAEDPEMAEAMAEFMQHVQDAKALLDDGTAKTFDEAMFMVTGTRPEPLDPDDVPDHVMDEIANAKFSKPN